MTWIKALLAICGLYDTVIAAGFLFAPSALFRIGGVIPPNHLGYVQFPALLLIIFAIMFFRAAANPVGSREIIVYGMALKVSYFGLVFWYMLHGGIPALWVPFAYADVIFFLLLYLAWRSVAQRAKA
ncbi:MAG TPA: hypothetical protein VG225_07705 [Terracidiphilus sp.]|jgi:hypothetical protein|nr:hypothetical protein [Terracidiphilus sp.]